MSPSVSKIVIAAFGLLLAANAAAQAAESAPSYETFKLVRTRNMFDPSRRAVRVETPTTQRSAAPKQNRSSSLSLTGTMVAEGKTLAFFSGTRADYSKVLSVGGTIADGKITAIKAGEVEMERGGKPVVLAVGQQLQIEGAPSDAPAEETHPTAAPADPANPAAPATAADPASAPAPAEEKNDILRRMMERRAKETSK